MSKPKIVPATAKTGTYIYENGTKIAAQATGSAGSLTFGATGSRLDSFDNLTTGNEYVRYNVNASRFTKISGQASSLIAHDSISSDAGLTVALSGEILNAETAKLRSTTTPRATWALARSLASSGTGFARSRALAFFWRRVTQE